LPIAVNAFCAPKEAKSHSVKSQLGEIDTWLEKYATETDPRFVFFEKKLMVFYFDFKFLGFN
jgi:hypothetical protein